jgi:diphthamide synthase (EF-2-diphthine--ammonia ligase)
MSKRAMVLWTGGKDSSLAFYKAKAAGYDIVGLVTFVPLDGEFLAHPLSFMKYQAEALGVPHYAVEIREPFKASYEQAISSLKEKYDIDTLVTGDIAEVDGLPNWSSEFGGHDT